MANRKRGADKLPTIKGYCKDCKYLERTTFCYYKYCGLRLNPPNMPEEAEDYGSCARFEPRKD